MALHNIQLSATDSNWRLFNVRKADKAFLAFQNKVHARDQFTCQYCGFCSRQHLEVVNLDGNYRNNREINLITACGFCAQCFFLESIGKGDFGGGTLIYLPEMTQGQLNAMCHVLFTAMVTGTSSALQARNVYRSFKLRSQMVEKQLGEGLSNPAVIGRLWVDADVKSTTALDKTISEVVRLLPEISRFATQVEDWAVASLRELSFI
jgi:intracellular multiplication protein IcmJ